MGVLDSIKQAFQNRLDKNKEEQEILDRVRKEASRERLLVFEEELKRNALDVARARAKKDAAEKSGMRKLQSETRLRRLNEHPPEPGSLFEKLRDLTQKNLARRDENLKRTAEIREVAKKMREERQGKIIPRNQISRTSFGQSTWKK